MSGRLTSEGYVDDDEKAYASFHGEEFEIRDMEIGHPPPKKQPMYQQQIKRRPQQIPQQYQQPIPEKYPKIREREPTQYYGDHGLILVKKTKMYTSIIVMVLIVVILTIGIIWFNTNFGKFADKEFSSSFNSQGDSIYVNNTHNIQNNPEINNDHTININNSIEIPEDIITTAVEAGIEDAFDFDDMIDEIVERLNASIISAIKNATNST